MTSKKQIRANRRNAKKSTGPKTKAGKERSARNAIKHGLFTDILLLPHEDGAALAMLKNNLHADFRPVTHMQAIVIDRLAMLIWRERRLAQAEASETVALQRAAPFRQSVSQLHAESVMRTTVHANAGTLDLARMLLIGRYQTMLTNQIERTLKQYFDLVEREDMFAPSKPISPAANDSAATLELSVSIEDGVELLDAVASKLETMAPLRLD
ncbi:MAG: hypothetical protein AAFN91_16310 [Pseudomonadota bacterium]